MDRRRVTVPAAVLAAGACALVLTGCSASGSEPSPPTGIDELVVPTPDPDPADFVARVDNPWLPLAVGASWTYTDGLDDVAVAVTAGPTVEGVATVSVVTAGRDGETVDHYAQDARGNVWWFGREGEWRAGAAGAEAGLAMAAHPRVGDGYRLADVPGRALLCEVLDVDESEVVPAGRFDDLVEVRTDLDGEVTRRYYAAGTGLVASLSEDDGPELELTAHDAP